MNYTVNTRKQGWISGFITCDAAHLDNIRSELNLDCTVETLMYIRSVFASLRRDPTVAELIFHVKAINSGCGSDTSVRLSGIKTQDSAMCELLASLVRRCTAGSPDPAAMPPLTALASAAASVTEPFTGSTPAFAVSLSPEDESEFPERPCRNPVIATAGGFRLIIGAPIPCASAPSGNCAALIYTSEETGYDDFVRRTCRIIASHTARDPRCVPVALTARGLLRDIAAVCPAAHINCSLLPGGNGYPESVFDSYAPGVLLFTENRLLPALAADAAQTGVQILVVLTDAPSGTGYSVTGCGTPVSIDTQRLNTLDFICPVTPAAVPVPLRGTGGLDVTLYRETGKTVTTGEAAVADDTVVSAVSVGGDDVYGALLNALGGDGVFAVCGTLSPRDPGCIPVILALDAVCRNASPVIAASRFRLGNTTSVTVFRLRKTYSRAPGGIYSL